MRASACFERVLGAPDVSLNSRKTETSVLPITARQANQSGTPLSPDSPATVPSASAKSKPGSLPSAAGTIVVVVLAAVLKRATFAGAGGGVDGAGAAGNGATECTTACGAGGDVMLVDDLLTSRSRSTTAVAADD